MLLSKRHPIVSLALAALCASPLAAQPAPADSGPRWQFFHGCWSTSSDGAIGPMICIVPDSGDGRAQLLSVVDDSIVSRLVIDASGEVRPFARGACDGFETARWSPDGQRLYMHAEYRCRKGVGVLQTSDAVIAATRPDAFTHVERVTSRKDSPARVVNFIVQLDTTQFPAEVKRRLSEYRTLTTATEELAVATPLTDAAISEAATELDLDVVQAWLADRGQVVYEDCLRFLRGADAVPAGSLWPPRAFFAWGRDGKRVLGRTPSYAPRGPSVPGSHGWGQYVSREAGSLTADHPATVWSTGWQFSANRATIGARGWR